MTEYIIIKQQTIKSLVEAVTPHLSNGYALHGDIFLRMGLPPMSTRWDKPIEFLHQAMTK